MKKKLRLRPFVFPTIYMSLVLVLLGVVYYNSLVNNMSSHQDQDESLQYVTNIDFGVDVPVIKKEEIMIRPYTSNEVKIGKSFYKAQDSADKQEQSIIYYEGTYIQNSGVDYVAKNDFDVVSCLDGTVVSVEKSALMGYIVEVKYNNDIVMSYQGLSKVDVASNDIIIKGQKIGTSGKTAVGSELGTHLHLEMYLNGVTVNPEDYYDKDIKGV